jgi:branched-chain amino acid transport system permease protein
MNWQLLPQFVATGVLSAGPVALTALGLVLIFKATSIFNFAQGHLLLLGALVTWWFTVEKGLPLWLGVLLALAIATLVGFLVERFALRPMTGQSLLAIILMTLGLGEVLQGLALLLFGPTERNFPQIFPPGNPYKITTSLVYNGNNIVVVLKQDLTWSFVVAFCGVVAISIFFRFTRLGLAMRATAEDHELAQARGLRIRHIFGLSWAFAGMFATVAGILLATSSGLDLSMSVVALSAFPVVFLGGLESIPGTIIGAIVIGLAAGFASAAKVDFIRKVAEVMPYVVLLVVFFIRPEGLFGQKRIERV